MENPNIFSNSHETTHRLPDPHKTKKEKFNSTTKFRSDSPITPKNGITSMPDIGRPCETEQISEKAQTLISHSWRGSTSKQYDVYIKKWTSYCGERNINPVSTSITNGVNFLASLFYEQNLGYSAINTARSALSTIFPLHNNCTFGQNHIVKRLLRGVFNQRPALPKYSYTWDVNIVLNYIKSMSSNDKLSLRDLTFKTVLLLKLLSAQRSQTLKLIKLKDLYIDEQHCVIYISSLLKQSKPGKHLKPIQFSRFSDERICIVSALEMYIHKTEQFRDKQEQLFLNYLPPHKEISTSILGRWIKRFLMICGVDVKIFGPHSTRAASTSAMTMAGCSIDAIMTSAGWSNAKTFQKFYNMPIIDNVNTTADALQRNQDP